MLNATALAVNNSDSSSTTNPHPLTAEQFDACMQQLNLPDLTAPIAVAVSGGPDSMALVLLAHEWAAARNIRMVALTVDHQLRPESTSEAKQVHQWLHDREIPHHILTWSHDAVVSNIQATARNARYALMESWCLANGFHHLLLAHHLEDQAETFLIRLGRGSGVDGLSAMSPIVRTRSLSLLRPLLHIHKEALTATLKEYQQPFISDPSNENSAFTRVKMRALLPALNAVGISADTLTDTARHMARARSFLEISTRDAWQSMVTPHVEGYISLELKKFQSLHSEIALRLLAETIRWMNNESYRPRFTHLEHLYQQLLLPMNDIKTLTLARCLFSLDRKSQRLCIMREENAVAPAVATQSGGNILWDNRFRVYISPQSPHPTLTVRALGQEGWKKLSKENPELLKQVTLPKSVIYTLPTLVNLEDELIAPHLSLGNKKKSTPWLTIEDFPAGK